jgi:hypothetical protein
MVIDRDILSPVKEMEIFVNIELHMYLEIKNSRPKSEANDVETGPPLPVRSCEILSLTFS